MSEPSGTVTLEMLGRMIREFQVEQRETRRELDTMRSLLLALVEQGRRTERRITELKDDLELMIRAELMGQMTRLERAFERRIDPIEDRLSTLEAGRT